MDINFVVNDGKTKLTKAGLEELVFPAMHDKLQGRLTIVELKVYFGETAHHKKVPLILDDVLQDSRSRLILVGHTTMDREIGEYFCFDLSGDAGDTVPFKVYDGTAIRNYLSSISSDPVWLGLVGLVSARYATPKSDQL